MKSRKSFLIRIDPRLYEELAGWAAQEFRSVNGQIEFLLREAVARRRRSGHLSKEPSTESPASEPEGDTEDRRR